MTARLTRTFVLLTGAVLLFTIAATSVRSADDEEPTFAVPAGDAAEILAWIETSRKTPLSGDTFDDRVEMAMRLYESITIATDRVLAEDAKATEEQSAAAITSKVGALKKLGKLGDPSSLQRTQAFIASLSDDKRPMIAALFKKYDTIYKFADGKIPQLDTADVDGSIAKMVEFLEKFPKLTQQHVGAAMNIARQLASSDKEKAAAAYQRFGAALAKHRDEKIAKMAPRLDGLARKLTLIGKPMDIRGTLVDGTEIDWSTYRGKVVLVDFWATWCGPCIGEIPNVLEQYEKYHDKGFEVLGISLDNDSAAVDRFVGERAIPWKSIVGLTDKDRGWSHPMAIHYGVTGIPTAILVGKDGKVVSLSARGPALGKQLEKLLGKAEKKKT